jgi:high-affinity nickel permease
MIVALMVCGIEAIGLLKDQLNLTGGFWDFIGSLRL